MKPSGLKLVLKGKQNVSDESRNQKRLSNHLQSHGRGSKCIRQKNKEKSYSSFCSRRADYCPAAGADILYDLAKPDWRSCFEENL